MQAKDEYTENSNNQLSKDLNKIKLFKIISFMHGLFSIFTLYDPDVSRCTRLTLYYLRLQYYLAINAVFVYDYTS